MDQENVNCEVHGLVPVTIRCTLEKRSVYICPKCEAEGKSADLQHAEAQLKFRKRGGYYEFAIH